MNILILGWRGPKHPNAGGAEQVVHEHAKGWVEAGHKVTLFTSSYPKAKSEEVVDGINIIRKSIQYWGVHFAAFHWYIFKKHPDFDLVIDQFHGIPFFTPLYVKTKKIALIQEVAKEVWFVNQLPWPINHIIGVIGYLGEPLIFQFYKKSLFMTGSNSAKLDLIKYGISKEKITVVPHGVLLEKVNVKKEKVNTIIFLGAVSKDKGVEDALKCFSILSKTGKYKFWIVGKTSLKYKKELEQRVKKLGLTEEIKFWGFVDEPKKFELLARSHILINPSIREGWGLVNIEANSVKTPVVAYNSAGLVDSVKDNSSGIIVKTNSPEDLAEAVQRILKKGNMYSFLQRGAVEWSKKFNWEKSRKLSLDLVNDTAN
ncbi:glycosyltransferase family 4 protein [Candidatus Microgenomates bacterium]|nr:glycosyltransferase family 4 protein [Candidatus Microgenomates bacterium]